MPKRDRSVYMKSYWRKHKKERLAYSRKYSKTPKARQYRFNQRKKRREFIFSILGNKCKRCGFSDKRALQMDHIKGRNGERKSGNIDSRWRFVRDNPKLAKSIYQILCANCNWIKRDENHEYFYYGYKPL